MLQVTLSGKTFIYDSQNVLAHSHAATIYPARRLDRTSFHSFLKVIDSDQVDDVHLALHLERLAIQRLNQQANFFLQIIAQMDQVRPYEKYMLVVEPTETTLASLGCQQQAEQRRVFTEIARLLRDHHSKVYRRVELQASNLLLFQGRVKLKNKQLISAERKYNSMRSMGVVPPQFASGSQGIYTDVFVWAVMLYKSTFKEDLASIQQNLSKKIYTHLIWKLCRDCLQESSKRPTFDQICSILTLNDELELSNRPSFISKHGLGELQPIVQSTMIWHKLILSYQPRSCLLEMPFGYYQCESQSEQDNDSSFQSQQSDSDQLRQVKEQWQFVMRTWKKKAGKQSLAKPSQATPNNFVSPNRELFKGSEIKARLREKYSEIRDFGDSLQEEFLYP